MPRINYGDLANIGKMKQIKEFQENDERTFLCGLQRIRRYGTTSTASLPSLNQSYIEHAVQNTDTLQGLALKYNCSVTDIKRSNRLWSNESMYLKDVLRIPVMGGETPVYSTAPKISERPSANAAHPQPSETLSQILQRIDTSIQDTTRSVRQLESSHLDSSDTHESKTPRKKSHRHNSLHVVPS